MDTGGLGFLLLPSVPLFGGQGQHPHAMEGASPAWVRSAEGAVGEM